MEEEADDMTYEKHIVMTETGIRLAEFLAELKKPEKEEFSSYIYTIYNTLLQEAEEKVITLIQSTKRFLTDDYDRIMKDIKHKINIYLHVAVGRMRFIYNRGIDIRGSVENTI